MPTICLAMKEHTNHLMWNMTRKCNFRCSYCYFEADTEPISNPLQAADILHMLAPTGRQWTVGMTGGEPFLYPGFVDLCRELTREHRIAIDTNLSMSNRVRHFAADIDPARVEDLYIALHVEERERRGGVDAFVENVNLLQEAGFHLTVNYVLHPDLLDRFMEDKRYYASRGVELTPRPFKGVHEGKTYPYSYSENIRRLFAKRPNSGKKMVHNFYGIPCEAGSRLLRLEPDGTVMRCSGDRTILGHAKRAVKIYDEPKACKVRRCPCFGPDFVLPDVAQKLFLEGLQLYNVGKADEAYKAFARACKIDASHSSSRNNMAVLDAAADRMEPAVKNLAMALGAHPRNTLYKDNLKAAHAGGKQLQLSVDVNPSNMSSDLFQ